MRVKRGHSCTCWGGGALYHVELEELGASIMEEVRGIIHQIMGDAGTT